MTSSSARSAPAAFMACRMLTRSIGLAPSVLSAFTTSARLAPPRTLNKVPPGDVDLAALGDHRLPAESGGGWLTWSRY